MQKKKKLFKRVKIDIITYLCVESKFCRRFQDSSNLKPRKNKKNIIFFDYRFVVRERKGVKREKYVERESQWAIRRERDSESNTLYVDTRERQTFAGWLDHLRENQRKVEKKKKKKGERDVEDLRDKGSQECHVWRRKIFWNWIDECHVR